MRISPGSETFPTVDFGEVDALIDGIAVTESERSSAQVGGGALETGTQQLLALGHLQGSVFIGALGRRAGHSGRQGAGVAAAGGLAAPNRGLSQGLR